MIITIDGPAASGKSTIARLLAKELGFYYLSSGMLFRSVSYVLKNYLDFAIEVLENLKSEDVDKVFDENDFEYLYDFEKGVLVIKFRGDEITPFLKLEDIERIIYMV